MSFQPIVFDDYVKNEKKTLVYILDRVKAKTNLSPIATGDIQFGLGKACTLELEDSFDFSAYWHIDGFGRNNSSCSIIIGEVVRASSAAILKDKKRCVESSSSIICISDGIPGKILRKIHFDYNVVKGKTSYPIFHTQFAGTLSPYMKDLKFEKTEHLGHLFPDIEEPRIIYCPMPLVFLFEIIFREFYAATDDNKKVAEKIYRFREDSYWQGLIKNAEKNYLSPFLTHLQNGISSKDTIFDFMYV